MSNFLLSDKFKLLELLSELKLRRTLLKIVLWMRNFAKTGCLKIISKKDNLNYENLNRIALFVKIIAV